MYRYHGDAGRPAGRSGLAGQTGGQGEDAAKPALAWTGGGGALPGVGEPLAAREVRLPCRFTGDPFFCRRLQSLDWGEGDESELCLLLGSGREFISTR